MSFIDASLATLQPAPVFPELYEPLWWYSGSYAAIGTTSGAGAYLIQKGSTTAIASNSGLNGPKQLFTLNSSTPSSTMFSLEIALQCASSGVTSYAQLYDLTTSSLVSGSLVSTTSTTFTVIRSGKFSLTPGHTYGISYWGSTSTQVYLTDASLIVFPSSPLTSPSVSAISLANPSGNGLKEAYIPLWVYSSGQVGTTSSTSPATGYLQKGSTSTTATGNQSQSKLYTLSSSWSPSQKFALEASFYSSSVTPTTYAILYDFTAGSTVSSSQISTTATSATVIRSSSFTLTPSHVYGVCIWQSSSGYTTYLTKAHLVALA